MPDPLYPQQYSARRIEAGLKQGLASRMEYEDRHKAAATPAGTDGRRFRARLSRHALWMKFHRRNIYSTRPDVRFRRSGPYVLKNFFCFHRFPHRLCTSYAPYCTGYPQPATHTGFAAGPLGASVAGYLFFGAWDGSQRDVRRG
jgi:hypothetical protein